MTLGNWWVMEECYSLNSKSLLADLRVTEDEVLRCLSCARCAENRLAESLGVGSVGSLE